MQIIFKYLIFYDTFYLIFIENVNINNYKIVILLTINMDIILNILFINICLYKVVMIYNTILCNINIIIFFFLKKKHFISFSIIR